MKYLLLFLTTISCAQTTKFIPVDQDILEFISEVNYNLYSNKNVVYTNITSIDSVTRLPQNIIWDSIAFSKSNYKQTGFRKESLQEVVRLSKVLFELDEVIIPNTKPKEILIGEKSRFVKRYSQTINKDSGTGLLFHREELINKEIKRLEFYVEKVKYKTTCKVKFFAAQEIGNFMTIQTLQLKDLLFETPIVTLEPKTRNKVEVNLEQYDISFNNQDVFVCLELQNYYDENNNVIQVESKEATRLKFQLSDRINYYDKTVDEQTRKRSDEIINLNAMVKKDFAYMFFKKPSKSILVAPAIVLYATKKIVKTSENKPLQASPIRKSNFKG